MSYSFRSLATWGAFSATGCRPMWGFGIANIGADYLSLHLTLATLYAAIELVLHSIGLVIRNKEQTVFDILCNMRDYLCEELGKERGDRGGPLYRSHHGRLYGQPGQRRIYQAVKKISDSNVIRRGGLRVRYILSMFDAKQKTLQAVLHDTGREALLREIRVCV